MIENDFVKPLVSVVITTYNYGIFLPKALASVERQTYPNIEIIVIDDGSTDDTKKIMNRYPHVKYFHQENSGLSAARNTGIEKSTGEYLVFLDADDWLEDDAVECNIDVLIAKPELAFVSGNYFLHHAETGDTEAVSTTVNDDHYTTLLQRNYIGMHAAVMYRRSILIDYCYDQTLKSCEDYDLYLRISRKHPVYHHQKFMATYYFHSKGLSHNYQVMIDSIRIVMDKQKTLLKNRSEQKAFRKGLNQWKQYYCLQSYQSYILKKPFAILNNVKDLLIFLRYDRCLLSRLLKEHTRQFFYSDKKRQLATTH